MHRLTAEAYQQLPQPAQAAVTAWIEANLRPGALVVEIMHLGSRAVVMVWDEHLSPIHRPHGRALTRYVPHPTPWPLEELDGVSRVA